MGGDWRGDGREASSRYCDYLTEMSYIHSVSFTLPTLTYPPLVLAYRSRNSIWDSNTSVGVFTNPESI